MHGPEISLIGTGDCGPVHGPRDGFPIERYSELVRPTLATADLRFGNCERQYSARKKGIGLRAHGCQPPEMAQIFVDCGFDAVTIANNHMILEDIAALRKQVDIVIPAFHWGVMWLPRVISDYQVTVAHACIDAGADLILGHHAHILKAVEVYKGKAIFYSLNSLCMTNPGPAMPPWEEAPWAHGAIRNHAELDSDYPLLPYGRDSTMSVLAKAVLSKEGAKRVSFLPMMTDKQYRPEVLRQGDARFDQVVRYMDWCSEDFDHKFTVARNEVLVESRRQSTA